MSRLITNSIRSTSASADAITFDGSGNATFPANVTCSGTATGMGGGKVLQIQSVNNSTQVQYTSTSFTVTNLTVNITPTSASSKIFITSQFNLYKSSASADAKVTIYRDSTNLGNATYGFGQFSGLGNAGGVNSIVQTFDSPNTTSQVTYAIYVKMNSGHNVYVCSNNVDANITAMEYST